MFWHVRFTDLGPMRIIRRDSLAQPGLRDRTYGWTVAMQARAATLGLRVCELPVRYSRRLHGRSKASGTVYGSLRAGMGILWISALPSLSITGSSSEKWSGIPLPGHVEKINCRRHAFLD